MLKTLGGADPLACVDECESGAGGSGPHDLAQLLELLRRARVEEEAKQAVPTIDPVRWPAAFALWRGRAN